MSATPVCADCGPVSGPLTRRRCSACYNRHVRAGTRIDLPRVTWGRAELVEEYLLLRAQGHTRAQIAERLAMTVGALDQALRRAALAGDTRIDYRPRRAA